MTRITRLLQFALLVVLCHCFCCANAATAQSGRQVQIVDETPIVQQYNRRMAISPYDDVPLAKGSTVWSKFEGSTPVRQIGTVNNAPQLQGATMGTIGPQGTDVTIIQGVMTAGTVRVNNLANLEAALNIAANGITFLFVGLGLYHLVKTVRRTNKSPDVVTLGLINTCSFVAIGLLTPGAINWTIAAARDAALFN